MDLNRTYFKHQILLMRAASARSRDARGEYLADAQSLAARIATVTREAGAGSAIQWFRSASPRLAMSAPLV